MPYDIDWRQKKTITTDANAGVGAIMMDPAGVAMGLSPGEIARLSYGTLRRRHRDASLCPRAAGMQEEFEAMHCAAKSGTACDMVLPGECGAYRVHLVPGRGDSRGRRVLVEISPFSKPVWSSASLRATYGLTEREASVVLHLLDGYDIAQTGNRLGLLPRSVRTYLSTVFSKTCASGQADLMRRLLG